MKQTYTIGALGRSAFRRALHSGNLSYVEDKGFLDSQFVVEATPRQHQILMEWINDMNYKSEYTFFDFKIKNGGTANEYAAYLDMFPEATYTRKKGWFKTTFTVHCHPHLGKVFLEAASNYN